LDELLAAELTAKFCDRDDVAADDVTRLSTL